MSKSATILGLAAAASAAVAPAYGSSAPAYGGSSAPAYGGSSAPAYGASSSVAWSGVPSSSIPAYPASSSAGGVVPSSSSVVNYPSSSSSYYPSSSSAAPTSPPFPGCWSECFQEAGVTSESEVCGNEEVATCIHEKCDCADTSSYFAWYNDYCEAPSSSSSVVVSPSSSSVVYYGSSSSVVYYGSSSSAVYYGSSSSSIPFSPVSSSASAPPSQPTIACWGECFAENSITSEDQLCGNTAVDACISEKCDCEDDKAYWAWYESYCPAPSSSSASPTTPTVPATPTPTDCWSKCFEEAGIASEDELCGNTAVDQCISSTCSPEEDKAYWAWYLSYCPSTGPVTTPCVTPSSSATPSTTPSATPSSPVDSCWSSCFAENDVTSEASLCGNDKVSQCIHDTCSAAEDAAYWNWYNGFCVATSTGTTTVTTVCTPLSTPYSPVTTTYVSTETYGWGPATSGPATGLPTPPASPPAPYGGYTPSSAAAVSPAGPTGTGYASPSASQWAPVPATGAGAATKPGVFFAAAMALVALF